MNSAIKKFNKTIESYLSDNPNDNYSKTISQISELYPGTKNYNYMFDSFTEKLGFKMAIILVHDEVKDRDLGYSVKFQFLKKNLFNEVPGYKTLIDGIFNFDKAHIYMAKQTLYKISSLPNLEEVINKMK